MKTEAARKFDLGAGHLGNGISVWNRAKEVAGDYEKIAHIDSNRKITWYLKSPPKEVIKYVEDLAKIPYFKISQTQDGNVFTAMSLKGLKIGATTTFGATTQTQPRLDKKKALREFRAPDFSKSDFFIGTGRDYGRGFELTISVPVDVDFLKKDSMGEFVHALHEHASKKLGVWLGSPTIGGQNERAKGGFKTIRATWYINDAMTAYSLGADLTQHYGSNVTVPKAEIPGRLKLAEKALKEMDDFKNKARQEIKKLGGDEDKAWKEKFMPDFIELQEKYKKQGISYSALKLK